MAENKVFKLTPEGLLQMEEVMRYIKKVKKPTLSKILPVYLQHDIDAFVEGEANNSSVLDCLWCELCGSINSAEVDREITEWTANNLRKKYLYPDVEGNEWLYEKE